MEVKTSISLIVPNAVVRMKRSKSLHLTDTLLSRSPKVVICEARKEKARDSVPAPGIMEGGFCPPSA